MCTVSMVMDHYRDNYLERWPGMVPTQPFMPAVSRDEFEALKREIEDMKKLLIRAKEYDERNGEPDCEMDEKVALIKQIAKFVGVDLDSVLAPKAVG